ncbi:efflux RND transporter periplasmic adaptor subunit [Leptospira interrogans]
MKRASILLLIAAIVVAGGLAMTGRLPLMGAGSKPEAALADESRTTPAPPTVSVTKIAPSRFVETVLVTGTLVPRLEILVAPEVEGLRVLELRVDEGDRVKKGDVMATLVHETLDAQLAQNTASIARADAAIAQARSSIAQAEATLEEARNAFNRAKPLRQSGHIAESIFDQREAAARTAEAAVIAARDGLKVAEAEKAQVEAQRRELDWRRQRTEVKAPEDGLVSRRTARIGAISAGVTGEPMFRIIARGEIELDAEVPEAQLARMKAGQSAVVNVPGLGDVSGQVRLVSPEVDRATRLGRLRIGLKSDEPLRIGGFGRGYVTTADTNGLAIPASAVLYGPDGASIQIVQDGKVVTRRVKIGARANGLVEIAEGASEGDVVVARAGTFLRNGDAVRPAFEATSKISEAN